MGMPKGRTGNPLGRPKGVPNKITSQLREAILDAARRVGQAHIDAGESKAKDAIVAFLERYGASPHKEERIAFLGLVGKVLPLQVAGAGEGPLQIVIKTESEVAREG